MKSITKNYKNEDESLFLTQEERKSILKEAPIPMLTFANYPHYWVTRDFQRIFSTYSGVPKEVYKDYNHDFKLLRYNGPAMLIEKGTGRVHFREWDYEEQSFKLKAVLNPYPITTPLRFQYGFYWLEGAKPFRQEESNRWKNYSL